MKEAKGDLTEVRKIMRGRDWVDGHSLEAVEGGSPEIGNGADRASRGLCAQWQ